MVKFEIVGGSGIDHKTLYGHPSSMIKEGKINNVNVTLGARHG